MLRANLMFDWLLVLATFGVTALLIWRTRLHTLVRLIVAASVALPITMIVYLFDDSLLSETVVRVINRAAPHIHVYHWYAPLVALPLLWLLRRPRRGGSGGAASSAHDVMDDGHGFSAAAAFRDIGILFHDAPATFNGAFSFHHHHAARRNIQGGDEALLRLEQ